MSDHRHGRIPDAHAEAAQAAGVDAAFDDG